MARILYLTKFRPGGTAFGGMIRTVKLLEALRTRHDVELIGFDESGPNPPKPRVRTAVRSLATGSPYQTVRYDTRWLRRQIAHDLEVFRPDLLHVDYLHQAPVVWDLPHPKALDLHNVESGLSEGIAESSTGIQRFMARRDARLLRDVELAASRRFQLVTAPSGKEAARMPGEVEVVVNGVEPSREPLQVERDVHRLCFVGIFSWAPNVDGAVWFVRHVLPLLPPEVRVQLVGRSPVREVQDLAGPRVEVTGEVPETWPFVCGAQVVLAPLLAPGGTRHKILEGLLAARPVVATPEAADGLEDLAGDGLVLAPGPEGFARAVIELIDDPARADELGRRGRAAVIERYSWQASQAKLLRLYEERLV